MDEISRINGAIKEEKIDIAKKLLARGQDIEFVVEITDLPLEKIKEIQ